MTTPIAVIDIGTNSTRLLIAEVTDGQVEQLERDSRVTRLGEGVDAGGRLAETAMARVFDVIADYRDRTQSRGADPVVAVATSAVRDAANGEEFRARVRERFGIEVRTISGDDEAQLTFLGATSAREDGDQPTLVIDIGGGSTEFVVGRPGSAPDFHVSTQAGSVRQSERHLHSDPPTSDQLDELRREVRAIFEDQAPADVRSGVLRGIAVAGTATQLASVDQRLEQPDLARVHGYVMPRENVERMLDLLASKPLDERRGVTGLDPDRAPTIVAGAAILTEAMGAFGLDTVETSAADILQGAAISERRNP